MTEDTKRAVKALGPLAEALHLDLSADETRLYINGQAVGIACNSTYATIMEGLGLIFLKEYPRFRYSAKISRSLQEDIMRYWVKDEADDETVLPFN